jgi:hypothetical protein
MVVLFDQRFETLLRERAPEVFGKMEIVEPALISCQVIPIIAHGLSKPVEELFRFPGVCNFAELGFCIEFNLMIIISDFGEILVNDKI